jgi:hypothetical protein
LANAVSTAVIIYKFLTAPRVISTRRDANP